MEELTLKIENIKAQPLNHGGIEHESSEEELEISVQDLNSMMGDFFVRNKIVRDAIAQQALVAIGTYAQFFEHDKESPIKIGILGAGLMGRIFIGFLNNRSLFGREIQISVSTRVPEKLLGQKYRGMNVFNNNAKLIKENDVVLICTPKHKNKIVFGSIKSTLQSLSSSLTRLPLIISIIGNLHSRKLNLSLGFVDGVEPAYQITLNYLYLEKTTLPSIHEASKSGAQIDLNKYTSEFMLSSSEKILSDLGASFELLSSPKILLEKNKPKEEPSPLFGECIHDHLFNLHFVEKAKKIKSRIDSKNEPNQESTIPAQKQKNVVLEFFCQEDGTSADNIIKKIIDDVRKSMK